MNQQDWQSAKEGIVDARLDYFESLGRVDTRPLSLRDIPSKSGVGEIPPIGWRRIRNEQFSMIFSEGLSDPLENAETNTGHGFEIMVETTDVIPVPSSSWLFEISIGVSRIASNSADFLNFIENKELGSLLFPISSSLTDFETSDGRIGVFVGIQSPLIPRVIHSPSGDIKVVTAKLLTPQEIDFLTGSSPERYEELRDRFVTTKDYHLSSLDRESVV